MTKCTEPMNDIPWELQDAKDCHDPLSEDDSFIAVSIVCFLTVIVSGVLLWFT